MRFGSLRFGKTHNTGEPIVTEVEADRLRLYEPLRVEKVAEVEIDRRPADAVFTGRLNLSRHGSVTQMCEPFL